jgi:hypothetical protein
MGNTKKRTHSQVELSLVHVLNETSLLLWRLDDLRRLSGGSHAKEQMSLQRLRSSERKMKSDPAQMKGKHQW